MEEKLFVPHKRKTGPYHSLGTVKGIQYQHKEGQKQKNHCGDKHRL
jgi:hypothetical protein